MQSSAPEKSLKRPRGRSGRTRVGVREPVVAPVELVSRARRGKAIEGLKTLGLGLLSSLLFSLAFPHILSDWGWFPLAFVALTPLFIAVHRIGWAAVFPFGFLVGFSSYTLFNYWLVNFHPLSIFIVPVIYGIYFVVLTPLLKLADSLFPRYGYVVQMLVWLAYEYLRTQGYLGYAYGIIGYSQYLFLPLVRLSSITGVWGVSALVIFPSAYLAAALREGKEGFLPFIRRHRIDALVYGLLFVAALVFGMASRTDYSDSRRLRVALVQQNVDPWIGGTTAYRRSLDILLRQSRLALEEDPEMIVWSETSFIPAIRYHDQFRSDPERAALVKELIEFLDTQTVPYVIGNGDGVLERDETGALNRVDYNAVLLYDQGRLVDTYRKTHLVPFTEHFPYRDQFPWLYDLLVENNTAFWGKGTDFTVFEAAGVRFSTPICFEDTFGYISRRFINEGAEIIVNLTNDSWSKSVPAAMQHMAMAVFRATENRRSVVRSTNGGMTTIIDPNGRLLDVYPAFVEGYMSGDVPVYTGSSTLYTAWGDWLAVVFVFAALGGLVFGLVRATLRRFLGPSRRGNGGDDPR